MKKDLGVHNNLFGGILLSWLDEAGAIYCSSICDTPRMVTIKVDEVIFKKPVKEGNQIKIYGEVENVGNTSITVTLEARKHNVMTGKQKVVCSTKITFVRIDEDGEAVPISDRVKTKIKDNVQ